MTARPPARPEVALTLAMALVASSDVPLLLLDGDLVVIAASASFCAAFHIDPASVAGQPVFSLGAGEWNARRLRSLLTATVSGQASVEAYEMDLETGGQEPRRLVLKAQTLAYDADQVRLLLTVADVTDARHAEKVKDDLIREKAILLRELQHRVANSLQIISSVILQSARKVQTEEARIHLHEAHERVMSVAAVQQQLVASTLDAVELRPYFQQLCQSLGASMIHDPEQLSIEVTADESAVKPNVSVSLGLIVTELVINALKHAFPDGRAGKIMVDYQARGPNSSLSVTDDGIGMPQDPTDAKPGLGTSIVEALAKQLEAAVAVTGAHPGTAVTVAHVQIAAVRPAAAAVWSRSQLSGDRRGRKPSISTPGGGRPTLGQTLTHR
jgi:two-component sensor histidine kinase